MQQSDDQVAKQELRKIFISFSFDYLRLFMICDCVLNDLRFLFFLNNEFVCVFVFKLKCNLSYLFCETMCRFTNTSTFFPRESIEICLRLKNKTSTSDQRDACLIKMTAREIKSNTQKWSIWRWPVDERDYERWVNKPHEETTRRKRAETSRLSSTHFSHKQ